MCVNGRMQCDKGFFSSAPMKKMELELQSQQAV